MNWFRKEKKEKKEEKETYSILLRAPSDSRRWVEGRPQTEVRPGQLVQWNPYKDEIRKDSGGIKDITYVVTENCITGMDSMGSYPSGSWATAVKPQEGYILLCLFKEKPKPLTLLDIDNGFLVNSNREKSHKDRLDMVTASTFDSPIKHETVEGLWLEAVMFSWFPSLQKESDEILRNWE